MTRLQLCPTCGTEYPLEGEVGTACPRCLLMLGLPAPPSADDSTLSNGVARAAAPVELPSFIESYRIIEVLGEGGMGIVYLAEQAAPARQVALKVIKPGTGSRDILARFETERQALARMTHPNIARVFDAGTTSDGRPYFVMEYAPGTRITDYCDMHCLSVRERLQLFAIVCEAIQHAHQKGVIHRDIKPSNILVSTEDAKPLAKVIDFGLAKATAERLTDRSLFTREGIAMGTPEYMSPEQAGTTGAHVDARSDIYSLGVLLYELLIGALPFDAGSLRRAAVIEMLRIIQEEDPPTPTTKLSSLGEAAGEIARRRQTDARSLAHELRGDLEWITMRAMEKDPAHRYASASELAADVRRHLEDEAVLAGPRSTPYRLKKFARKHRTAFVAAAASIGMLIAALVAISAMYVRSEAARRQAETEAARSVLEAEAIQAVLLEDPANYRKLSQAAMAMHRQALRNDERLSLFAVNRLAILKMMVGPDDKGVQQLRQEALELVDRALTSADPRALGAAVLLADLLDPSDAAALAQRALRATVGNLRTADDTTVTLAEKLFQSLEDSSMPQLTSADDESLESFYRQSLARQATLLPSRARMTRSRQSLAAVLQRRGERLMRDRDPAAQPLFRETLTLLESAGTDRSMRAMKVRSDLAASLTVSGKFDEAEQLLLRVVPQVEKERGVNSASTHEAINRLADVYTARRAPDAAARARAALPPLFVSEVSELGAVGFDSGAQREGAYSTRFGHRSVWVFGGRGEAKTTIAWTDDLDMAGKRMARLNVVTDLSGEPADVLPLNAVDVAFNAMHGAADCAQPPCGARRAIAPRAVVADQKRNRLILFYRSLLVSGQNEGEPVATSIALWTPGTAVLQRVTGSDAPFFGADEPAWGSAAVVVGEDLYAYACDPRTPQPKELGVQCRLARVPLSKALDRTAWQFFAGSGRWSSDWKDARPVLDGGIQWGVMSVHWNAYLGKYLAVSSRVLDARIQIRFADRPEGPWSEPPIEVDTLESSPTFNWTTMGLAHPELSPDGGRTEYFSYRRNVGGLREIRIVEVRFGRK